MRVAAARLYKARAAGPVQIAHKELGERRLHSSHHVDDESDEENGSEDATDIHVNLRWVVRANSIAWREITVGTLPHTSRDDHTSTAPRRSTTSEALRALFEAGCDSERRIRAAGGTITAVHSIEEAHEDNLCNNLPGLRHVARIRRGLGWRGSGYGPFTPSDIREGFGHHDSNQVQARGGAYNQLGAHSCRYG